MGLWWKTVDVQPPKDSKKLVTFDGDPKALSKRWPVIWRLSQNWHIIRVEGGEGYHFFFRSHHGHVMQYRKWLYSDYVAVRVGPESVTFWAQDVAGAAIEIHNTSITIPGYFREDTRHDLMKEFARQRRKEADFI
jgi:hypothetical protein